MTMQSPNFDQIFGSLKKYGLGFADKCSANKTDDDCEWAKVGNLDYCKIHKGIRVKK